MPAARRAATARASSYVVTLVVIAACLVAKVAQARAVDLDRPVTFDIEAQPVGSALIEFSKQANIQIVIAPEADNTVLTPALHGTVSARVALEALLRNTGLKYTAMDDSVTVTRAGSASLTNPSTNSTTLSPLRTALAQQEGGADNPARVAQPSAQSPIASGEAEKGPTLAEVVVTAQKREERLQDVPVPVTALNTDSLLANGNTRLEDYYSQVPGLTFTSSSTDLSMVAIRGIITGAVETVNNPSVGIVVDDVPFGASTALGGGSMAPDFDPSTLQRIEVLRGPQGTLYGASSLGGLIKYVTVDPSTEGVRGSLTAGISGVHNGAEPAYNVSGSINIPLTDTVAMLASAFTRQDAGYVDNPVFGLRGVNESRTSGGRVSLLWRPSESFTLKLAALYQDVKTDGSNFVDPTLGDLKQADIPDTGWNRQTFQVYSATMTAKLGPATLTSVTGYSLNKMHDLVDYDAGLGFLDGLSDQYLGIPSGSSAALLQEHNKTDKFTQELRLATPLGDRIDWLLGAFYTHERSPFIQTILAGDPLTGGTVADWGSFDWVVTFAEYSGFTDLTFKITDRFDVQIGGRTTHIEQTYKQIDTGAIVPVAEGLISPHVYPEVVTHDNAFTYLATPRFRLSPDVMLYARLASGYRPGGPNPSASAFDLPLSYKPDKTNNYEIGIKGDALDHRLTFDASAYYIDWKNIQLAYVDPDNGFGFEANGSRAKSEGLELSSQLRPVSGLTLAAWVAWNNAVLTQPFPPNSSVYGATGERLPFGPRFSANFSVDEEFPITANVMGFAGGSVSYVGNRVGNFTAPPPAIPPRQDYAGYAKADLHVGAKFNSWTANLFVNNLTDRRGVLFGGLGTVPNPAEFTYIQPRTVGVSATYKF